MSKHFQLPLALALTLVLASTFSACSSYDAAMKTTDYNYKYETAKQAFAAGHYTQAYQLLDELILPLKGTQQAEESLFMLALCHFNLHDYETAAAYLNRYAKNYPKGTYTETAKFLSGKAQYLQSPDPRLDQQPTYTAINTLQQFIDTYPYSAKREEATDMLYQLQDRLVNKEFQAAQLYYNLGSYVGNCYNGGSNYQAAIITAENALKSYPYTNLREDLYMLILRSKYQLAANSVPEKAQERYRQTIDEYYGFKNQFPESEYIDEANKIFKQANNHIK